MQEKPLVELCPKCDEPCTYIPEFLKVSWCRPCNTPSSSGWVILALQGINITDEVYDHFWHFDLGFTDEDLGCIEEHIYCRHCGLSIPGAEDVRTASKIYCKGGPDPQEFITLELLEEPLDQLLGVAEEPENG